MSEPPLSERDVCTKLITPALERAGWDIQSQVREEVSLTAGRVMVRGRLVARGTAKRADYVLYLKPNLPLAVVEAKDPGAGVRARGLFAGNTQHLPGPDREGSHGPVPAAPHMATAKTGQSCVTSQAG
jgi:hypothetical protein